MPWNPDIYSKYKELRNKPVYDLISLIEDRESMHGIDLGCGTGEQTSILVYQFKGLDMLGVDSSEEMLEKSKNYINNRLHFELKSIEDTVNGDEKYDLVFSNAALQWVYNHEELFPKVISLLQPDGQLAIQMPVQKENRLNQLLIELANEKPYAEYLQGFIRDSPVLSMDGYAQLLFDHGMEDIEIIHKIYPQIAGSSDELYEFISGSAMIPYLERLDTEQQADFIASYKERIKESFNRFPAIYSFKRLLIYGKKRN